MNRRPSLRQLYLPLCRLSMVHWFVSVCWQADRELAVALASTTVRSLLAMAVSLLLVLLTGSRFIRWLGDRTVAPLKQDSPRLAELSQGKQAIPSMGGVLLIGALASAVCLLADISQPVVQLSLLLLVGLALLGACDDLLKRRAARRGLTARGKLAGQILLATLVAVLLYRQQISTSLAWRDLPLFGPMELGLWFIPWAVLMIVGMSNAVNLTDGLDGLAGGCVLLASMALAVVTYSSELLVVVGSMIGAVAGFLWFNVHPARIFMGDTGSLPLGGMLGFLAVTTGHEPYLLVACGVLLVEAGSVVLQVGSYKLRRKRIFLCAPLHHHFQFAGWPETKVVARFWMAAALCALAAIVSLRAQQYRTSEPASVSKSLEPIARSQQVLR